MMSLVASSRLMSRGTISRARDEAEEAGGGVGGHRDEDRDEVVADALGDLAVDAGGHEGDGPGALARVLDEAGALEGVAGVGEEGFGDLLQAVVDRSYDGGAAEDGLAELQDLAADQVLGQRADERGEADEDQEAEAEDVAAEDVLRVVAARDEGDDLVVDEADEPPER